MLCRLNQMFLRMKLSVSSSLRPQWGRSVQGPFWEAAALEPPQVQLFPLCPGALRQARPTCGGGEDLVCGLRWAWQGLWASLVTVLSERFPVTRNRKCNQKQLMNSELYLWKRIGGFQPWPGAHPDLLHSPVKLNILNSWRQHVYTSFTLNELMMGVWNRISND